MNSYILSFLLIFGIQSVSDYKPESQQIKNLVNEDQELSEEGLVLLQKHCYTCHNPKSKSHDEIIAPPLWGVKNHYLKAYPNKESFVEAVRDFVQNPNEEKAIMKGPIKRFGLMPKPVISDSDLDKIIDYVYENEIENPAWHIEKDNHKNGNKTSRE
ncbi:MAG: c-type cytochrome [Cyclobacteriaceae bacterium]|nr:c-type cytochrome [Cyclobacteriaceae bacterium]